MQNTIIELEKENKFLLRKNDLLLAKIKQLEIQNTLLTKIAENGVDPKCKELELKSDGILGKEL